MDYLIIEKIPGGYKIKNSIDYKSRKYYGFSLRDSVRNYREFSGLKYKHLKKIYI